MSDKIVNHFVLADGSTAKYDAGALLNLDETVSLVGYAPDAKAVGDKLTDIQTKNTEQDDRLDGLEADESVTTARLVDGSVTNAKIADNSISTAKIGNSAITTDKLANASVTTKIIANRSVTQEKLSADVAVYLTYVEQLFDALNNGYTVTAPEVAQGTLTFAQGNAEFLFINS